MKSRLCLCVLVCVLGCGPTASTTPVVNTSAPTPAGPEVPQPQFEHWSQFPVGTKVVRRKETTNPNGTVIETETLTLVGKSDKEVQVDSQIHVKRHDNTEINNPAQQWKYPAVFRLPPGMTLEQFKIPSLKAKKTGEEKVTVGDAEYQADVYEWTEVNEAGPMKVKLLLSPTMPGEKVRQELNTEQTKTTSVEVIAEVSIAKP